MKRGEIWWVDLDPAVGSETKKRRAAVIVSNDASNRAQTRVQIVPLTSANVVTVYPWEAAVRLGARRSKAMADQIRTVARQRLKSLAGATSPRELRALDDAIRFQLGL